jgi:hypothetical protein
MTVYFSQTVAGRTQGLCQLNSLARHERYQLVTKARRCSMVIPRNVPNAKPSP